MFKTSMHLCWHTSWCKCHGNTDVIDVNSRNNQVTYHKKISSADQFMDTTYHFLYIIRFTELTIDFRKSFKLPGANCFPITCSKSNLPNGTSTENSKSNDNDFMKIASCVYLLQKKDNNKKKHNNNFWKRQCCRTIRLMA